MGATPVTALGVVDRGHRAKRESLARIGVAIDPHALIAELVAELQFVEIAQALVADLKL
jgi:ABC-type sugar transport system ATPase subunit